ncbi:MAG: hypothetical protein Q8M07_04900, partial [Prosthecobacter sp.]|nr:hypothetical protein [Prosthecobacter sp.]
SLWPAHASNRWLSGNPREPVLGMGFKGAKAYCDWLNTQRPGYIYDLPTNIEASSVEDFGGVNAWLITGELKGSEFQSKEDWKRPQLGRMGIVVTMIWTILTVLTCWWIWVTEIHFDKLTLVIGGGLVAILGSCGTAIVIDGRMIRRLARVFARALLRDRNVALKRVLDLNVMYGLDSNASLWQEEIKSCSQGDSLHQLGKFVTRLGSSLGNVGLYSAEVNRESIRSISEDIQDALDPVFSGLKSQAGWKGPGDRSLASVRIQRVFEPLINLGFDTADVFTYRSAFRLHFLAFLDALKEASRTKMPPQLKMIHESLLEIANREAGRSIPREGIRLVRRQRGSSPSVV